VSRPPFALPDHGGGSLTDVLPAALTALGRIGERPGPDLPACDRIVVALIDGLGMSAMLAHAAEAPFLSSLLGTPWSRRLTTVFPSTTPIALTSLGTGLTPGEHGITGLFLRLPTGQRINTLAMPAETDLRALQPRPTVFERVSGDGVAVTVVGPKAFDGNGLSLAGLRGGDYAAAESPGERVAATAAAVRRGERALVYFYYGELDATGHRLGCTGEAWRAELTHVDRLVEQLAATLPAGAVLVVTSDHGMLDIPVEHRWDLAASPVLDDGVEALTGDLRGAQVHVQPGAGDDVLAAWRGVLGDAFWVVPQDEAVATGLYGPTVAAAVRARLGDVLAVPLDDHWIGDSRVMPPAILRLAGMHGGLSDAELGIPLLVHRA
jgi:hypothetical protein